MKREWSNPEIKKINVMETKEMYRTCLDEKWPAGMNKPLWDQNEGGYWYCCSQGQGIGQPHEGYYRCSYLAEDNRRCNLYNGVQVS